MLNEQTKQLIRDALAVDFKERTGDHKAWVEDVCDCPPHHIELIINDTPEEDQDELTDFLHEAMGELLIPG